MWQQLLWQAAVSMLPGSGEALPGPRPQWQPLPMPSALLPGIFATSVADSRAAAIWSSELFMCGSTFFTLLLLIILTIIIIPGNIN